MSRTKRNVRKYDEDHHSIIIKKGGDALTPTSWLRNRKMNPYVINKGHWKFKSLKTDLVPGLYKGLSKYEKLITKNANRSLKKGVRQKSKLQIKRVLEYERNNN